MLKRTTIHTRRCVWVYVWVSYVEEGRKRGCERRQVADGF
jgi:hypothetical protein